VFRRGIYQPQYDWSIQVQYKAPQADNFGSAPSGGFAGSINPPFYRDKLS
jgi:hypothetical protein